MKTRQFDALDLPKAIFFDIFLVIVPVSGKGSFGEYQIIEHSPDAGCCVLAGHLYFRHMTMMYCGDILEGFAIAGNDLFSSLPEDLCFFLNHLNGGILSENLSPFFPEFHVHEPEVSGLQFLDFLDFFQASLLHADFLPLCVLSQHRIRTFGESQPD
jgi:hypothetical protein